jgi:septal ring factor EnvC (AmiA/AmiB activator)
MTAPQCIINLFTFLGLKDSEEKQLKRDIAASEERIRASNKQLNDIVSEIKSIEAECLEAKAEFDSLQGVARETARIRLDSLLKARNRISERNLLLDQQLNAEMLILQNLHLQLENLNSRSAEELEEVKTEKEDLVAEHHENTKAAERLEKTTFLNIKDNKNDNDDKRFDDFN